MDDFDFMNSPDFGALGYQRAQAQTQHSIADTMKTFGEIAMMPVEEQLKTEQANYARSHAGLADAQAQAARQKGVVQAEAVRQSQAMSAAAGGAQAGGAQGQDPLARLEQAGTQSLDRSEMLSGLGLFEESSHALNAGAGALGHVSTARSAQTQAVKVKTDTQLKGIETAVEMLRNVKPENFAAVKQQVPQALLAAGFPRDDVQGIARLLRGMQYGDPQLDAIASGMLTEKERIQLGREGFEAKSRDSLRKVRERVLGTLEVLDTARTGLADRRREMLGKAGKALKVPTGAETLMVLDMIKKDFPDIPKAISEYPPGLQDTINSIAARAAQIKQEEPQTDAAVAQQRAYREEVEAGSFQGMQIRGRWGRMVPGSSDTGPESRGKSPDTALALPEDKKYKVGRYYIGENKEIRQHLPKGKWGPPVTARPGPTAVQQRELDRILHAEEEGEE